MEQYSGLQDALPTLKSSTTGQTSTEEEKVGQMIILSGICILIIWMPLQLQENLESSLCSLP